ncbi:hypothetical protein RJ55_08587 [Drechmeria coniospora]|nr:hypothetical protein RJ55_08587 [Drechmeria coniospora]
MEYQSDSVTTCCPANAAHEPSHSSIAEPDAVDSILPPQTNAGSKGKMMEKGRVESSSVSSDGDSGLDMCLSEDDLASSLDRMARNSDTSSATADEELSATGELMQSLWAQLFHVTTNRLDENADFFALGGDVTKALQLTKMACNHGIAISARDIFQHPRLAALSVLARPIHCRPPNAVAPFSLLGSVHSGHLRAQAAQLCHVRLSDVADVLPCTPLQEGLLALTQKNPGHYVAQFRFEMDASISVEKLRRAWDQVVASTPILRTRIVSIPNHGLFQAVLDHGASWASDACPDQDDAGEQHMGLGTPLTRFSIVEGPASRRYFIWHIHHALYDGWSMSLMLKEAEKAYYGEETAGLESMAPFIKYIQDLDESNLRQFWLAQFANMQHSDLLVNALATPLSSQPPRQVTRTKLELHWGRSEFTPSTMIRAAWAVVMARRTNSNEALYGVTMTGRQAEVPRIEYMAGPAIATVPFRVIIDWESSVGQFLYAVQRQGADMIPYEQTGLQRIRRMGGSAAQACAFQSLLVVQPAEKEKAGHSAKFRPFMTIVQSDDTDSTDPDRERDWGTYPIEAECQLGTHDVRLQIDFDCSLVQKSQAEHITQMFNQVLRQLVDHAHGQVSLGTVAEAAQPAVIGLDSIRAWNSKVPDTVEDCVHARFTRMAARQPLAPAVCAWDGDLTYQRLDRLSTIVAGQLVDQGVSGTLVPLLFEKSLWMPVAVLAVMKAGGALVALDMKQPEERLSAIVSQIDSPLLLSSRQNAALAGRLGKKTVVIEGNAEKYPTSSTTQDTNTRLPTVKPSSLLYVVFTSGTTGKPKGVMISHGNFCSAIAYQQRALGYGQECRVFDFASYAFDVAWSNLFFSLTSGACLCIPSALERENDVDGCLKKYHINFMDLTPSLARTIGRDVLSRLSTIILGGEASLPSDVSLAGGNTRIINAYGPSECTPTSHLTYLKDDAISIGHGVGVCTWVIDPDKPDSLVSIGVPGELWIEGPLVGLGYLNDSKKTQSAFVQDPPWLFSVARRNGKLYRTGDLVRYRDDGTIVYMGRKDTQVKIRGQRVELGEVETRLRQLLVASSVAQVIVEATQSAGSKHTALVAFITLSRAQEMTETAHHLAVKEATNKLADRLSKMLPSYMIPAAYFAIREIPMTTTGKADRRQLRNIGASFLLELRNDLEMKDAPAEILNETESLLKTVWMSVLNLSAKQASINTTFSRLGGDSISAMQIVSQCRLHNLGFTVGDIYQNNTIRKLASHCKSACKSINGQVEQVRVDQESKEDAAGLFDLSPIQQAYFDSYPDGLNHYNQSFLLDLGRKVDYDVLLCAIQALVRRHAMLRARFRQEPEGERRSWKQMVVEPGPESFSFVQQSVAHQNEIESIAQGRQERLDICKGPVFACDLFNLPHGGQIILLSAHHLVVDLVSWRIIWNEVEEFLMLGELRSPEPLSFRSWCAKQAKFGRNLSPLSVLPYAIPEPQLDFWGLSPEDNTFGRCEDIDVLLSASTTELLFGSSNNSLRTEAVDLILGALFYSFLHTFPERDLPPIWIEGHGREQFDEHFSADVSGTVGWFTTLYPLTMSMTLNDSISHVVRLVKDTRKKVPGKGQLFFACQHYSESGRQTFQGHSVAEVVFNFTGRFQQLEKHDSILKQSDSIRGTDFKICEISKDARRQAIIELNGGISHGQLGVTCSVPMHARHKLRIRNWIHNFAENLEFIVQTLTDAPTGFTLHGLL